MLQRDISTSNGGNNGDKGLDSLPTWGILVVLEERDNTVYFVKVKWELQFHLPVCLLDRNNDHLIEH